MVVANKVPPSWWWPRASRDASELETRYTFDFPDRLTGAAPRPVSLPFATGLGPAVGLVLEDEGFGDGLGDLLLLGPEACEGLELKSIAGHAEDIRQGASDEEIGATHAAVKRLGFDIKSEDPDITEEEADKLLDELAKLPPE